MNYFKDILVCLAFILCVNSQYEVKYFGGEPTSLFGLYKIDLADLAFDFGIFENHISSLSINTLIGVN